MTMIGIDLGTTNSLVGCWTEAGPKLIPNVLGKYLTPSVVSVDDNGEVLVGQIAKERMITHPQVTASAFKRYMGTEKRYPLGRYTFTPEELSSFVIRSLKEDAEAHLGHPVTGAVISVPAYFNDTQRRMTRRAAELAGLKVERLISEPTAAAISYGLHEQQDETTFLVFDLGGGTFDVSILEFFEGVMEVKSIAGDNYLGGEDFTQLLISHFIAIHNLDEESLDSKERSALFKQAEICKREISTHPGRGQMVFTKGKQQYELEIDRDEFEQIAAPLILRLRHPVERAIRDAQLSPEDLDAVILIGGATRMPMIRSVISKMFGQLPFTQINPDEAVALGAVIQVALKERNEALKEVILTDVCPFTLGIETTHATDAGGYDEGHFSPIIERNTPIPVSKVEEFCTLYDNQQQVKLNIFQGESRKVKNNVKIGELRLDVPRGAAGEQVFAVRFTYDINGILEVEVTVVSTGVTRTLIIEKEPGKISSEEIRQRLEQLKDIKIHPRDRIENRLLLAQAERLYEETLGEKRREIEFWTRKFENVLALQDEHKLKAARAEFKKQLEQLEKWFDY
ncbi:molecular chaperone HscC [Paenibacillus bovis]|uniref:Chaperone protein DnaK n=1 Tax=Paenibacillus bovis TaxID=1616788 RepID=A0A172ZIZ9_9BACL|nr:molecular chaperone HscC [Paenibacillus bovis]ANF97568.1 molecular chaperone HscC [Paenibacillus bovis]